jgi:hypothetical protein
MGKQGAFAAFRPTWHVLQRGLGYRGSIAAWCSQETLTSCTASTRIRKLAWVRCACCRGTARCPYVRPRTILFLRYLRQTGLDSSDSARTAAADFRIRVQVTIVA